MRVLAIGVWSVAVTLLAPPAGQAQAPPAVVSPEVTADRRIVLRLYAPSARQVTAAGELDGKPHPMTKGADGVWSVTVGPLEPDIYTYAFNVDGISALDPRNNNTKYGYGNFGPVSVVQVPGDGPQFYDVKDVPHGDVRIRPYVSRSLGVTRTAWIYTPADYEQGKDFPVLYLLHGAGDIESGWTMIGRANTIIDNLIAEKKARSMVVVMPLGHTIQSFWTGPAKSVPDPVSAAMRPGATLDDIISTMMSGDGKGGLSPFGRDLVDDVMPMVEKTYKVSRKPEQAVDGRRPDDQRGLRPAGVVPLRRLDESGRQRPGGRVLRQRRENAGRAQRAVQAAVDWRREGRRSDRPRRPCFRRGAEEARGQADVRGESRPARVDGVAPPPCADRTAAVPVRAVALRAAASPSLTMRSGV
jgi:hypothetical protein